MTQPLDAAYRERNQVVVALARLYPSCTWVAVDPTEPDWPVLYIELPSGQVSWHFSPADADLLAGFPRGENSWDGHTTEQKYDRLSRLGK